MITLTIDGRKVTAEEGQTVLDVARRNNIYIPTLCVNEAVQAYGACRLCLVEATKGNRTRLVASCLYPVAKGIDIKSDSERIVAVRRMIVELLLARCPQAGEVKRLAERLGVGPPRFKVEDETNLCILCGLCTRVCQEVVGQSAISLVNRGTEREVSIPFYENSDACIACGSCAYVCPTDAITMDDAGGTRVITMPNCRMEFKMKLCPDCDTFWAPEKQLDWMATKAGISAETYNLCPDCRG
jgi:NADH dehydrogenase/NADH:ubiquinone oxidoreductase subunit G